MTKRQGKSGAIDVKAVLAADEEFLRALVRTALQEVLEAEMTEALGAEKGERATGLPVRVPRADTDHAGRQARIAGAAGSDGGGFRPSCSNAISVRSGRWWRRWRKCTCRGSRPA
jgi:hypothetical protein